MNNNCAIYNPHNKPIEELPIIYGYNAGKPWQNDYLGYLLSEDGKFLGSHVCSNEQYMLHDLGILEGTAPSRHAAFREHYPDGYRMDFVSGDDVLDHEGLKKAFYLYEAKLLDE